MLTDDRIRHIARNAGFGGISDSDVDLCRAVEAEARREALEELIAAGFISNAYVVDAQEHINGKRT